MATTTYQTKLTDPHRNCQTGRPPIITLGLAVLLALGALAGCGRRTSTPVPAAPVDPLPTLTSQPTHASPVAPTAQPTQPLRPSPTATSQPYTLTLPTGWYAIPQNEPTPPAEPIDDADSPQALSSAVHNSHAIHSAPSGAKDGQLTVTTMARNGIQLETYLASATAAFSASRLEVESAAIHDGLRSDHTPVAVITYTVATSGRPPQFPHGRQVALISADGTGLIIASLAAGDPGTASEIYAIAAGLNLGPRPTAESPKTHHSSNDWSASPTMRKVR